MKFPLDLRNIKASPGEFRYTVNRQRRLRTPRSDYWNQDSSRGHGTWPVFIQHLRWLQPAQGGQTLALSVRPDTSSKHISKHARVDSKGCSWGCQRRAPQTPSCSMWNDDWEWMAGIEYWSGVLGKRHISAATPAPSACGGGWWSDDRGGNRRSQFAAHPQTEAVMRWEEVKCIVPPFNRSRKRKSRAFNSFQLLIEPGWWCLFQSITLTETHERRHQKWCLGWKGQRMSAVSISCCWRKRLSSSHFLATAPKGHLS